MICWLCKMTSSYCYNCKSCGEVFHSSPPPFLRLKCPSCSSEENIYLMSPPPKENTVPTYLLDSYGNFTVHHKRVDRIRVRGHKRRARRLVKRMKG
jgi:ribosomal protein S27E